ncbi:MAG: GntR family transcriptional regulator [Candidatus Pacebacteria bacterium]|nr:GntR family transcriptional regulator [Candidatus Paceibacterota bacterium]
MLVLTKTEQVEQKLRNMIAAGNYAHGAQLPTEKEMMRIFGVGKVTVRAAVDRLEADGLVRRRRGSGTYVNCPLGKSEIAIVGRMAAPNGMGNDFQTLVLSELQGHIREASFRPVLHFGSGTNSAEYRSSLKLFDPGVLYDAAGVIGLHDLREFDEELLDLGIPAVGISLVQATCRHCVVLDHAGMLDRMVDELQQRGIDEFAFVHFRFPDDYLTPGHQHQALARLYESLEHKANVTFVPIDYGDGMNPVHAYGILGRFLEMPNRPRCVVFADDCIFALAFPAIFEHGLQVPRDIQIISHLNLGRAYGFPKPVTGIGFNPNRIADELWHMLNDVMRAPGMPSSHVMIEPEWVRGETL